MAITALAAYSADIFGLGTGGVMSCLLTYGSAKSTLKVDKNNLQVLQTVEVCLQLLKCIYEFYINR